MRDMTLAVKRVTENQGKKTAGVDKVIWETPKSKAEAVMSLKKKRLPAPTFETGIYTQSERKDATSWNPNDERQSHASATSAGTGTIRETLNYSMPSANVSRNMVKFYPSDFAGIKRCK